MICGVNLLSVLDIDEPLKMFDCKFLVGIAFGVLVENLRLLRRFQMKFAIYVFLYLQFMLYQEADVICKK
jgi:hypothetical protein